MESSRCRDAGTPDCPWGSEYLKWQRKVHVWDNSAGVLWSRPHIIDYLGFIWFLLGPLTRFKASSEKQFNTIQAVVVPGMSQFCHYSLPLWCWEAKGWKCLAYCNASIWLQIPPLSRLMKYKRCNLNSRLLFRSKRRCRFVTAHLRRHRFLYSQPCWYLHYLS